MRKLISKEENKYLVIRAFHDDGRYIVSVRWEIQKIEGGCLVVETIPFSDGNFCFVANWGRKNQKRLDAFNEKIEQNADYLKEVWERGDYALLKEVLNGYASGVFAK